MSNIDYASLRPLLLNLISSIGSQYIFKVSAMAIAHLVRRFWFEKSKEVVCSSLMIMLALGFTFNFQQTCKQANLGSCNYSLCQSKSLNLLSDLYRSQKLVSAASPKKSYTSLQFSSYSVSVSSSESLAVWSSLNLSFLCWKTAESFLYFGGPCLGDGRPFFPGSLFQSISWILY